ncbi:hypothetical protein ACQ4LE_007014 [Meloidogyne hapla]|uniref:MULE domain-containing protein n=2 Tax=Meloidogyne hapla TaxID=6305 RepID=A0A1I8B0M1_MELHA
MANQSNVNKLSSSPTPPTSNIRPKLEQIQRYSTRRKRPLPKEEVQNDESLEDFLVVDDGQIVLSSIKNDNGEQDKFVLNEEEELVEFGRGCTNKGALCIWHSGYRYIRVRHDGPYWRCTEPKCPSKASAVEQEDGRILGKIRLEHSHLPQPERRLAEIKRHELKQRAREDPSLNRVRLIASIRSDVDDETFVAMGSDNALGIMAYREKAKLYGKGTSKISSNDVMSIQFPPALIEKGGQSILLYDSRPVRMHDDKAVFVFAHSYMLQHLAGQSIWAIGSTFKSAPRPFKQCFIIGAIFRNQLIIAAHALLPQHSEEFYIEALEAIANAIDPAKPRKIITDFENDMVVAAQKVFPEASVSGCYFRYAQALFKKWRDLKLGALYGHEKSLAGNIARMTFRRLLCLALIPPSIVIRAFYIIASEAFQIPELAGYLFYFKRTYIGLTDYEYRMKSAAFGVNFGQNLLYSPLGPTMDYSDANVSHEEHVYAAQPPRYEIQSPSASAIIVESTPLNIEEPIIHQPFCPIEFWNISERAASALLNTNYAMETAHFQIKQNSKYQPSIPDYLLAFWDDFEKQRDNIRSVAISNKKRNRKYVIKEELVASTLNEASYETDQAILNTLDMLSHHVQGYVNGLHFDTKSEKSFSSLDEGLVEEEYDENINDNINNTTKNSTDDFLIYDTSSTVAVASTSSTYC